MKKIQIKLTLINPARKSGGDKYEGEIEGQDFKPYLHYIPQSISRDTPNGQPAKEIMCTLEF